MPAVLGDPIRTGRRGVAWPEMIGGLAASGEVRAAAASVVLLVAAAAATLTGLPLEVRFVVYAACYASGGWVPGREGVAALRARTLDVDLLMVVAALTAAAIGEAFDGALLIVIFATSGALEAVATMRTARAVRSLLDLTPDQAVRLDSAGGEQVVDAAGLVVGNIIVVRPGARVSADGIVVAGSSEVDQSSVTGESLPADRGPGDEVFAGTSNGSGMLEVEVTRPASESVLARIVAMVEHASATKAEAQLFIEKVEQRYSLGMVAATIALFVVPLTLGAGLRPTLLRAMTFMIVASPCGVVLATMPPLLSAIANAGRHGVLVKSAAIMERFGTTSRVAFDKTGTLTEGRPCVVVVHARAGVSRDMLLALAAGAEAASEHPLGRAIVAAARARGLEVAPAEGFRSIPGRGVHATVAGRRVGVSKPGAGDSADVADRGLGLVVDELERRGQTAVMVEVDGVTIGVVGVADNARVGAADAVGRLTSVTGASPVLLTGDNIRAATTLASQVGITDVRAGLLPEDKLAAVAAIEAGGHRVLLVGDGVNDAPAMAAAHLGMAMGQAGSDLALESSDAVIVRDELGTIPALIAISRRARTLMVENLVVAGAVMVGLVVWDLAGHLPLPLGVAGHEGSTVLIGVNGLRLLRPRAWGQVATVTGRPGGTGR